MGHANSRDPLAVDLDRGLPPNSDDTDNTSWASAVDAITRRKWTSGPKCTAEAMDMVRSAQLIVLHARVPSSLEDFTRGRDVVEVATPVQWDLVWPKAAPAIKRYRFLGFHVERQPVHDANPSTPTELASIAWVVLNVPTGEVIAINAQKYREAKDLPPDAAISKWLPDEVKRTLADREIMLAAVEATDNARFLTCLGLDVQGYVDTTVAAQSCRFQGFFPNLIDSEADYAAQARATSGRSPFRPGQSMERTWPRNPTEADYTIMAAKSDIATRYSMLVALLMTSYTPILKVWASQAPSHRAFRSALDPYRVCRTHGIFKSRPSYTNPYLATSKSPSCWIDRADARASRAPAVAPDAVRPRGRGRTMTHAADPPRPGPPTPTAAPPLPKPVPVLGPSILVVNEDDSPDPFAPIAALGEKPYPVKSPPKSVAFAPSTKPPFPDIPQSSASASGPSAPTPEAGQVARPTPLTMPVAPPPPPATTSTATAPTPPPTGPPSGASAAAEETQEVSEKRKDDSQSQEKDARMRDDQEAGACDEPASLADLLLADETEVRRPRLASESEASSDGEDEGLEPKSGLTRGTFYRRPSSDTPRGTAHRCPRCDYSLPRSADAPDWDLIVEALSVGYAYRATPEGSVSVVARRAISDGSTNWVDDPTLTVPAGRDPGGRPWPPRPLLPPLVEGDVPRTFTALAWGRSVRGAALPAPAVATQTMRAEDESDHETSAPSFRSFSTMRPMLVNSPISLSVTFGTPNDHNLFTRAQNVPSRDLP